jgi:uncharacterized alpha-E superfamily protein
MLSRVADSLYWMSRYIERAENIARLLEVNLQLMLDFQDMDDDKLKAHWEPILRSGGDEALFRELYDIADSQNVTDFLTFNTSNPDSILSSLFAGRENARMIRDQLSSEMWETVNKLYLFLRSQNARRVWESGAHDFFREIKENSHLFQGLTDATFPREEGYDYMQFGKYLERADRTARILDLKYHILLPSVGEVGGAVDVAQWQALLRSAGALEAYHRIYVADVVPWKVAEFLIFSETFPRSIRFCLKAVDHFLHHISGVPLNQFSNEAERLSGRLLGELNFSSTDDLFRRGLHEYLGELMERLEAIDESVFKVYLFRPQVDMAEEIQQQQQ